jgi:hypothetical protein
VHVGSDAGGVLEYAAGNVDVDVELALLSIAVREGPVPVCAGGGEASGDAAVIGYLHQYCGVVDTQE